tara:strand:+ start:120 stop:971 length:852 start_codon:yes stop_codon:yes gene_type:complete
MAINKGKVATEIGTVLLEPTLNLAGEKIREWFSKQDPVTRTADLLGNIGTTTRTRILGGLTDEVNAPSVNIADYKRAAYEASPHNYGGMSKQTREGKDFGDEAYFRSKPRGTGSWMDQAPETIAGRDFYVTEERSGREDNPVLVPNTFASNLGINDLERAKYASEIAGWGASTAALGAAALGMNALMRGNKPRSAYSLPVQDSGGYNPNVEASRASYEYAAKLEMLKQQNRERNEWARQQARTPGVQQYSSPPMGGYGHYPDMNFNAAQMASSIINAPTPVYG